MYLIKLSQHTLYMYIDQRLQCSILFLSAWPSVWKALWNIEVWTGIWTCNLEPQPWPRNARLNAPDHLSMATAPIRVNCAIYSGICVFTHIISGTKFITYYATRRLNFNSFHTAYKIVLLWTLNSYEDMFSVGT